MTPILHRTPDMMLETLGFLYIEANFGDNARAHELTKTFLHTDASPAQRAVYTRFLREFHRARKPCDGWQLFEALHLGEYVAVVLCFLLRRELLFDADGCSREDLLSVLEDALHYLWDSGFPLLDLRQSGGSLQEYVKLPQCSTSFAKLANAPEQHIPQLAEAVRRNIPAAEAAWDTVRSDVRDFMDRYWQADYFFAHTLLSKDAAPREIVPVFFTVYSSWFVGDVWYCGIYNITVPSADENAEAQKLLLDVAKALGDQSRLDILRMLHEKPRYNREIAEALGLSPATVMHHTDLLLQCRLVSVCPGSKNQKRTYFQLETAQLQRFCDLLRKNFL